MKKITFALVLLAFLTACSNPTPFTPPNACETGDSLILDTFPDPRPLSDALLTVNLVAMETVKGYGPEEAVEVLAQIEKGLAAGEMTYADAVTFIIAKTRVANKLAGAAVFMLGPQIQSLSRESMLSECDAELIRRHLARQMDMLAAYQG